MNNTLGNKFTFFSLIKFAFPNIMMMMILSLYVIVDGIFVSRFIGTTALSAVNMVYPLLSIQMAIAIMFSSGASAIIARKLGENKTRESRENFTLIILILSIIGLIFTLAGIYGLDPILSLLGVSDAQFDLSNTYLRFLLLFSPFFFLQTAFQTFFITAGKPHIGLMTTLIAGIVNIVLDYIFIVTMQMGIAGAALGTGIGYCIPSITGLLYFSLNRKVPLHFTRPRFAGSMLLKSCSNGSSEMVTNLSNAITTMLFNYTFLKYYGEDGVAAITIILYFQFIFTAIYFGYAMGIAPIISYKYGANDVKQLKAIFHSSIIFLTIASLTSYILPKFILPSALGIFTEVNSNVFRIVSTGFPVFSVSFLFMGFSIFASSLFTAYSDGRVSAIISFSRTFLFLVGAIVIMPLLLGPFGVWLSVPVAESLGAVVTLIFLIANREKYQY